MSISSCFGPLRATQRSFLTGPDLGSHQSRQLIHLAVDFTDTMPRLMLCFILFGTSSSFLFNHVTNRPLKRFAVSKSIFERNVHTYASSGRSFAGACATLVVAGTLASSSGLAVANEDVRSIPYSTALDEISASRVQSATFSPDEKYVMIRTTDGESQTAVVLPSAQGKLVDLLMSKQVPFTGTVEVPPITGGFQGLLVSVTKILGYLTGFVFNFAFPLFLVYLFIAPRIQSSNSGPIQGMSNPIEMFGSFKKGANVDDFIVTGVNFTDVAGCDEAKFELNEVVDFLKNTTKYSRWDNVIICAVNNQSNFTSVLSNLILSA